MYNGTDSRSQRYGMISSKNLILMRLDMIRRDVSMWKKIISNCPAGRLRVKKCGNYRRLYVSYGKVETALTDTDNRSGNPARREVYVGKDSDIARQLAEKEFFERSIKRGENEIKLIKKLLKKRGDEHSETVDLLPPEIRELLPPDAFGESYTETWKKENVDAETLDKYSEEKRYEATDGTMMRSKSEVIIANELIRRGIPFVYEKKTFLPDGTIVHPDFTMPDAFGEREIILEFFGMMGDPDYADNTIRKINMYQRNGFLLGDNFFALFESGAVPFDTRIMMNLLDRFERDFDMCA